MIKLLSKTEELTSVLCEVDDKLYIMNIYESTDEDTPDVHIRKAWYNEKDELESKPSFYTSKEDNFVKEILNELFA